MKIALIGNQNSGKTTLFNLLTGSNQKIGNWPGVTIEKKSGIIRDDFKTIDSKKGRLQTIDGEKNILRISDITKNRIQKEDKIEITDLPGIYSLSPYSSEEKIATDFLFNETPDLIINIIDATILERSLYLTTQLLELDCQVIIALNMVDRLEEKGLKINIQELEKKLGVKICPISALKQTGIEELIALIKNYKQSTRKKMMIYDTNIEEQIVNIESQIARYKNTRFLAVKILEKDERFKKLHTNQIEKIIKNCEDRYQVTIEEEIATQRYKYIEHIKNKAIYKKRKWINTTEILDKIFLNKIIAIPIFICIMGAIYFLSVGVVGKITIDIVENAIDCFSSITYNFLESINVSDWLKSLITDGIIKGVGSVLSFVPQLCILFLCISVLESTGYISRVAFMLDKIFRKIGLSGKALIPFIVGSGCSVPGIMSTRIIENEKERKTTSILVPFIPCSAKLPIIALFSGYFFKENSGLVSCSLYFISIIVIIISAILMKKFIFKSNISTFISELPDYKRPSVKYLIRDVTEKVVSFIKRAGSTILLCSVVVWFLLSFSINLEYGVEIENSILALIGKKISFIFYPIIGENSWEATISAIQGLIAKEQVVSSMSIIAGFKENQNIFAEGATFGFFNQVSAYAFVVFNLFSAPCFAAIGAMKKELGGTRQMLLAITFQTLLAWILASIIGQLGQLL